ncbi:MULTISPECIES: metallophosphoesterase [Acidobacterium]|uniref:Ser/Thr protein phosphatase family protein n=1 Tax=Acidobacterium capsulatum (strain ATCC 51196 / DSM 11244 / BCRC 80197 / JCM 7670 / NBRC 15755 / NCIMB 13165 / 161) TaxID=240015 RepID=C1F184_ACIC5|nr:MULTISPECIES: metallophosphoesterase [Acidobacterium]ACO32969.1 Ser/Thr protein phosphatase family protein [Acidobacterium capsulatum ATCC 51196]HCT62416.1 hypothetical protein [Acidobacterium sp.]
MLHTHVIAPHLTRHKAVGKPRRAVGDPVATLKEYTRFIPIPNPAPNQLAASLDIFDPAAAKAAREAGKLVFHCVGDIGGIYGTATEESIATAMEEQIKAAAPEDVPRFHYVLGDVIYFNGQQTLYKQEFYEPYQYYPALIFAIPGNHDGDTQVRRGDAPDGEPSLYGFFNNFCAAQPEHVTPYRMSMTQPYCYWTLQAPFVTMVGLYSNVEGSLDARGRNDQQAYLEAQMAAAPRDAKLVVTVHHPPYSLDSAHGGTPDILLALDRAIQSTGRLPDAVLSGHVHNYQRFTRTLKGKQIPYIVSGAGGYANTARSLHKLQKELTDVQLPYQTTHADVQLESFQEEEPGFLRITVDEKDLTFDYFTVSFEDDTVALFDSVTV